MHNYIFCWFVQEFQSCNTLPCPDLKKTTPWTPWTPVNISDNGGHYEQRFRYTCKARVPEPSLLEVGRQRIEMRYCSSDGSTGCSTDGEISLYLSSLRFFHLSLSFFLFSPLILLFLSVSLMEWAHSDFEASHLIYLSISGETTWCALVLLSSFHSLSLINVGSLHQFLECCLTQHKCSWLHSALERHKEHANEVKSANVISLSGRGSSCQTKCNTCT